jgi:hypothetical protein
VKSTTRKSGPDHAHNLPGWVLQVSLCCAGSNSCITAKAESGPLKAEQAKKLSVAVHDGEPAPTRCLQGRGRSLNRQFRVNCPVTDHPESSGLGSTTGVRRNIGALQGREEEPPGVHDQRHMDVVVIEKTAHLLDSALRGERLWACDHDVFHAPLRTSIFNHASFQESTVCHAEPLITRSRPASMPVTARTAMMPAVTRSGTVQSPLRSRSPPNITGPTAARP